MDSGFWQNPADAAVNTAQSPTVVDGKLLHICI